MKNIMREMKARVFGWGKAYNKTIGEVQKHKFRPKDEV